MTERTSPSVAKLAGRMLKTCEKAPNNTKVWIEFYTAEGFGELLKLGTIRELKAVFAALTAPDKRKKSK